MALLLISLLAGILSVLAPCIIAIIPLLVGYSVEKKDISRAIRVVAGLAVSIFIFSILLKSTTLLIDISPKVWQTASGSIIILFGIVDLFPTVWEVIAQKLRLQQLSAKGQKNALRRGGKAGDFLLGASLGPVFSACSPTYALIVATILPATPLQGLAYLLTFIFGLAATTLLIACLGQKTVQKLGWTINPHGWFKRTLSILFIVIGVLIITGADKKILRGVVENGWFDWQTSLESNLQKQ